MALYRDRPTGADRAKAIVAVAAVHLGLAALALSGWGSVRHAPDTPATMMFDVALPPPPPPPTPPPPEARAADRRAGTSGRKAEAAPVAAPEPRIVLPPRAVLPTAPVAGLGSAPNTGAGTSGTGPGAGGTGSGDGGGGGGGGGGIGEDAHLLEGGLNRRDYRHLRAFDAPAGRAVLGLMVGPDGRVAQCSLRQSSGDPSLDAALCNILQPRMRWSPARDRSGRALTVGIVYTAVWSRD